MTDKRMRKLFREVLEHWTRLSMLSMDELDNRRESPGGNSCAFCRTFYHGETTCGGCPVVDSGGLPECHGTPWQRAIVWWLLEDEVRFRNEAVRELEFLKRAAEKHGICRSTIARWIREERKRCQRKEQTA